MKLVKMVSKKVAKNGQKNGGTELSSNKAIHKDFKKISTVFLFGLHWQKIGQLIKWILDN